MTSLKQIAANRRNALLSTGPTSSEGKQQSRRNALRHGLTAETVIHPLEDCEDYRGFEAAVIADYDAESAVERELVLRLASILWRLRRATGIETALFASTTKRAPKRTPAPKLFPQSRTAFLQVVSEDAGTIPGHIGFQSHEHVARRFLQLTEQPTFAFDRLSRYEHLLWRQARQIILTLESFQRRHRPNRMRFPFSFHHRGQNGP